ncbi:MAG TPA: ABC transporter permease subunit [Tepidisphaeraceae bacterium]|nr:ABC transporter permease subunit [Tepidisphaeraceae bacterium]
MLGVGDYLWRLLPANPILLRVVETGGKRKRDLAIRCAYLGLLVFFVIFSLLTQRAADTSSLTDLSNASRAIFRSMSYLQLGLVSLLAPIFTAGAITQEKDSQTYDILLATPLSNAQILLGSLLSRLFFVIALLVSGIPIFSVTQIFGGVAIGSIVLSCAIAASTALITGALAMAIATFKVGTRRTIFSFYLFIVIYLVGGYLLDLLPYFQIAGPKTAGGQTSHISWFTGIHPFLALRVALGDAQYQPPDMGILPEHLRYWPVNWYLTNPSSFYITATSVFSLLLIVPSILLLRRLAQSTNSFRGWILQKLHIVKGDRTRKPRNVWYNPIAWREAKTKASAARASFLRWAFIIAGSVGALVMVIMFATPAALPAKYIMPGGFNAVARTLFINGDTTYGVPENVQVLRIGKDGPQPGDLNMLGGRYEVAQFDTQLTRKGIKELKSITLGPIPRRLSADDARNGLLGAVILEFAVILLIVTNAAASTVTREKEDGSLDLLLTTPITSRYYIWGKLRGLVSFVLPLVAVPVASVTIFVMYDLMRIAGGSDPTFQWIVFPEAILIMPPTLVIVAAFASILGMQMSLRCRTTVRAVMSSVGIVAGISAVLVGCGQGLLGTGGRGGNELQLALAGFSPFTLVALLINPYTLSPQTFTNGYGGDPNGARMFMVVSGFAATAAYAAVVWTMYKSMVKNFDMTIRRQSR